MRYELPVHYDIYGRRYNFAHESIKCRADQGGTEVYEVEKLAYGVRTTVLVLAYNRKDAEQATMYR